MTTSQGISRYLRDVVTPTSIRIEDTMNRAPKTTQTLDITLLKLIIAGMSSSLTSETVLSLSTVVIKVPNTKQILTSNDPLALDELVHVVRMVLQDHGLRNQVNGEDEESQAAQDKGPCPASEEDAASLHFHHSFRQSLDSVGNRNTTQFFVLMDFLLIENDIRIQG